MDIKCFIPSRSLQSKKETPYVEAVPVRLSVIKCQRLYRTDFLQIHYRRLSLKFIGSLNSWPY
jgi:hypothetical protein